MCIRDSLGVVLVLLAVLAGVLLVTGTASIDAPVAVDLPFGTLSLPPLAFLITGMVVISIFWLGWAVLRAGLRRQKRLRAQATEDAKAAQACLLSTSPSPRDRTRSRMPSSA